VSITKSASSSFETSCAPRNLGGGAKRYCNPEEDLPDFEAQRNLLPSTQAANGCDSLHHQLQQMTAALTQLDAGLPDNEQVNILKKTTAGLEPFVAQPEPLNLLRLKGEIGKRWL